MRIERFEDIIAWQKAKQLTIAIYSHFKGCKDYSFRDQIRRVSVSIMNNIAEGYERNTNKEFKHFLYISKGFCGEVRSMLHLARELNYLDQKTFTQLRDDSTEIAKILSGFIKTL